MVKFTNSELSCCFFHSMSEPEQTCVMLRVSDDLSNIELKPSML